MKEKAKIKHIKEKNVMIYQAKMGKQNLKDIWDTH